MFQADRTVSLMALSREELRVLDRKEGSETREQCVRQGCVWGEVGGKGERTHAHSSWVGALGPPLVTCHGKSQPL